METIRICPKCGKSESQYTYFCSECGTKTVEKEVATTSKSDITDVRKESIDEINDSKAAYNKSINVERGISHNKSSGSKLTNIGHKSLIGIVSIVTIIVVGVIVATASGEKKQSQVDESRNVEISDSVQDSKMDNTEDEKSSLEAERNESEISDLILQGNYTNWGNACYDSENIYFTDFANGIYCSAIESFLGDASNTLIANGFYSDLGVVGNYILTIKSDEEESYIVRIDRNTYVEEVGSTKYANTTLVGQDIVNDKFYYVVGNDRLYYIENASEERTTSYRNVLKKTKYGIFTTTNQEYGLEYIPLEDDANIISYGEFEKKECGVAFSDEETAIICDYTDGAHDIYKLDLKTKAVTQLFDDITASNLNIITALVNVTDSKYILSITCGDEQGKYVSEIYSYSKSTGERELIFSKQFDEFIIFTVSSVLPDDILFTSYPISGTGYYNINSTR